MEKNVIKRKTSISLDNKKKYTTSLKMFLIYIVHLYSTQVKKQNRG